MNGVTVTGATQLEARLRAVQQVGTRGLMQKLVLRSVAEAKLLAPHKTGNLRRTILPGAVTTTMGEVKATANYAGYVEHGTRPHTITPNARKALRWAASGAAVRLTGRPTKAAQRAGGAYVFAKRVNHPGTKAHPFLLPGAERAIAQGGLSQSIIAAWNEAA